MTQYSVQPRERVFVKGYGFFSFAKNMGKNISENISKNYIVRNFLIMLNNLPQMRLKLLQLEQFKKTAKVTGDLIGNKIANKITRASKHSK